MVSVKYKLPHKDCKHYNIIILYRIHCEWSLIGNCYLNALYYYGKYFFRIGCSISEWNAYLSISLMKTFTVLFRDRGSQYTYYLCTPVILLHRSFSTAHTWELRESNYRVTADNPLSTTMVAYSWYTHTRFVGTSSSKRLHHGFFLRPL